MNGNQQEIEGWREFIGEQRAEHRAIMSTLAAIQKWQVDHDKMETGWHARIESHISAAGERHEHVQLKFSQVEKEQDLLHREHEILKQVVDQLRRRMWMAMGILAVTAPILLMVLTELVRFLIER